MIQKNNLLLAASIALFLQTRWVSAFHVSNPHKNVNLRRFPGRMDHGGVHTRTKNSVSFFVLPQDEAGEDVLTNDKHIFSQREGKTRRSVVQDSSRHLLLLLSAWQPRSSPAAAAVTTETSSSSTTTAATTLPKITDRILIDVRIARPDGTFYVRGDETDDLVKKYSLKIGLFGNQRMWNDFYRMCVPRKKLSGTTNLFHPTVNPDFNPLMKPRVSSMEEAFLLWKRPSLQDRQPCDMEEGFYQRHCGWNPRNHPTTRHPNPCRFPIPPRDF